MKICKLILCFFMIISLSGCYDMLEPNEYAYVVAIGVDNGNNGNYKFTVQFAKPNEISGGSSQEGGKGGDIIENISVEAPNIYSAVGLVNDIISKNLSLAHMKLIVFSQEIAEDGIGKFLETMVRSGEIKPNIYVAVCKTDTKKYLEDIKPIVEINPAKYYRMIYDKNDFGAVPKTNGMEVYFDICTPEKEAVTALSGVVESADETENINHKTYEYGIKDYKAGEIGNFKEEKSEAIGSAVFKGDKMIGELGLIETDLYNLLTNEFTSDYMTIKNAKSEHPITLNVTKTENISIDYNKKKNTVKIKINLEGEFISLPDDYIVENEIEEFQNLTSTAIKDSILIFLEKTKTELGVDIVGFGKYAHREFMTYNEFQEFNWEENYKNLNFDVDVNFVIRRTGLTKRK